MEVSQAQVQARSWMGATSAALGQSVSPGSQCFVMAPFMPPEPLLRCIAGFVSCRHTHVGQPAEDNDNISPDLQDAPSDAFT
eukprot:366031-Chlamydomonas_euryale.AAC.7